MRDDAPLVICENDSYHKLLHRRMAVKVAGGDPNTEAVCNWCGQVKPVGDFARDKTTAARYRYTCKACRNQARREVYATAKGRDGRP